MPFPYPKSDIFHQIRRDTALPSPLRPDTAMPFPYPESDIFHQICGPDTAMPFPYPESDIFHQICGPDTALPFPYPESDIFHQICGPDTAMPFPYLESDIFHQICGPDTAMPFPYPKSDIFHQICRDTALPSPLRPDGESETGFFRQSFTFTQKLRKKPGFSATQRRIRNLIPNWFSLQNCNKLPMPLV